jgi:hypothetical protein
MGETQPMLTLMNSGPGVAMNIVCALSWGPPSGLMASLPQFHLRPGGSDDPIVPVPQGVGWDRVTGTITCIDLAGDTWLTEFVIRTPRPNDETVLDVKPPRLTHRSQREPAA